MNVATAAPSIASIGQQVQEAIAAPPDRRLEILAGLISQPASVCSEPISSAW